MAKAKAEKPKEIETKTRTTKKPVPKAVEPVIEKPDLEPASEVNTETEAVAKAGKRSAKAIKEVEDKQAKEVRKAEKQSDEVKPDRPRPTVKPSRSREERAGKKYREAAKLVDRSKAYSLAEALELAVKTSTTKFDSSVELHINLGVDPKLADQNVRDTVALPAGTGKTSRVAVLAEPADAAKAKTAGADLAGSDEIFALLDKEDLSFDILIAAPAMMPKLGKYARLLGPRGLMPNPKSVTVTADVAAAVKQAKAGRVEYRVDQAGIVHLAIGKTSFGAAKLGQNAEAILASIRAAKPASLKGNYILSAFLTTTMGPSIRLEV